MASFYDSQVLSLHGSVSQSLKSSSTSDQQQESKVPVEEVQLESLRKWSRSSRAYGIADLTEEQHGSICPGLCAEHGGGRISLGPLFLVPLRS